MRRAGSEPTMRSAAVWSAIWIGLGVLFGVWLAVRFGVDIAMTYWTAYALEKALSDSFLVYTSNVFALFGLRSLYFLLERSIERLRILRAGLGVMLLLVAAKMLLGHTVEVSPAASLIAIGCILGIAIAASKLFPERGGQPASAPCSHLDQINHVTPASQGCEECLRIGDRWVHLRMCLTCGHVGSCDSSKNKHAARNFQTSGHPIMQSVEPGEDWRWCFIDQVQFKAPP